MAGKRTERVLLVLGGALVVALVGLIVSGSYLKWFYRPTEAQAWTDIRKLHTDISTGLLMRNAHRWLGRFVAVGMPVYAVIFAFAGSRQGMVVKRRWWAAALLLIVLGLIGPSIVVSSLRVSVVPLRRWYLVHETPAYMLLPAVVLALVVRPRSRRSGPPT